MSTQRRGERAGNVTVRTEDAVFGTSTRTWPVSVRRTALPTITRAGSASSSRSARVTARSSPWRSPDQAAISTSTRYRSGIAAAAAATWVGDSRRSVTGRDRPSARRGTAPPRIVHGFDRNMPSPTAAVIAARSSR